MNDAHNHLQDTRFDGFREDVIMEMLDQGIQHCVVNGTRPSDWAKVAKLAKDYPEIVIPSFGLHPWHAAEAINHPGWLDQLTHLLDTTPNACIGECGLDRGIEGYDKDQQTQVFTLQLKLAASRNLPISIHCVRAWGQLIDMLESTPLPQRGFLLHSYGGSAELIPRFARLGGYFSFSGAMLRSHKQKTRDIFTQVPPDRLLLETDAPDMLPPNEIISHPLAGNINHPANLPNIANAASHFLDTSQCEQNFNNLFR